MDTNAKVLIVDDDQSLREALARRLRDKFQILLAESGEEGLRTIDRQGPVAVVVSDLKMPGMDGVAFLDRVGRISPDTVRMILTGNADLEAAIRAVNEGHVFRFITKPSSPEDLERALRDGIKQYQFIQTEREYYFLKKTQESMTGLVSALVRLVDIRDPYTAGHQIRVAQLAATLARELGLAETKVEEIRLAAMIHDIGKIYVPAEFLAKPGKLNSLELDIVKLHAQIGHDILEPISFPFPLPKIVRQHHERLDGSGYPQGLASAEIMPEAKIIAVADVVEAMSSHRPYRPSLGLQGALDEIRQGQGRLYQPEVVEACLDLFTNRGWSFPAQGGWQPAALG